MKEKSQKLNGRITLGDNTKKFSRFGVFEKIGDDNYICFEHIDDGKSFTPVYIERTPQNEQLVNKLVSPGDVVSVKGAYRNEGYFIANQVEVLSKSQFGRKSEVFDLSPKVRENLKLRGEMLNELRTYFNQNDFMEVTTPILMSHYEGGDAVPFSTMDAKKKKLYLKETNEIVLRKLLSLGAGRVYEIGKSFRNIGTNKNSLNEFTVVESAIPYIGLSEGMDISEGLLKIMLAKINPGDKLLQTGFERIPFADAYKQIVGKSYIPSGNYEQDRRDLDIVLDGLDKPSFLVGLPKKISPINKEGEKLLNESVLVIDNSVYSDVCEFDTNTDSLEKRLREQELRNGRFNDKFIEFAKHGLVPGVGISFGLERWMKYFNGENIVEIKNLGGAI